MISYRIFSFISFFIFSITSFSQDYSLFYDRRPAKFIGGYNNTSYIDVIRLDTINGDTIFQFQKNLQKTDFYKYCGGYSWSGKKAIKKKDKSVVIVNINNDSIFIKPTAAINESWTAYTFLDGSRIDLYVDTIIFLDSLYHAYPWIDMDTITNASDSLKIFKLQFYNQQGDTTYHELNGLSFEVLKHHGIYTAIDFLNFPAYNNVSYIYYWMWGIQNPEVGIKNVNNHQIFDFDPGDILHIYSDAVYAPNYQDEKIIKKYLSKKLQHDSLIYEVDITNYQKGNSNGVFFEKLEHDTILEIYPYYDPRFDGYPEQPAFVEDTSRFVIMYSIDSTISTKKMPGKEFNFEYYNNYDGQCYSEMLFNGCYSQEYYKGLGGPYYSCSNGPQWHSSYDVVYYKKGTRTFGSPFSIPLSTTQVNPFDEVSIYPNPIQKSFPITVNVPQLCKMTVTNVDGKFLQSVQLEKGDNVIAENLNTGFYLLKFENENAVKIVKLVVK